MGKETEAPANRITLRDVLVDFFGSLIPGIIFCGMAIVALVWPAFLFVEVIVKALWPSQNEKPGTGELLSGAMSLLSAAASSGGFWTIVFVLVISLAYVLGHLFYRQDPKNPDRASFQRLVDLGAKEGSLEGLPPKDLPRWVVNSPKAANCEFPYINLKAYVEQRCPAGIAKYVDWTPENPGKRTKNFVNGLKIRIELKLPHLYIGLARNEAHVRLMSSVWYLTRLVSILGTLGLFFSALTIGLAFFEGYTIGRLTVGPLSLEHVQIGIASLLATAFVSLLGLYVRRTIERFFHYQRVREVTFVLETAFAIDPDNSMGIWDPQAVKRPSPSA